MSLDHPVLQWISIEESSGNPFIVDSKNDQIHIFQPDGILLRSIGSYGRDKGQFRHPMSMSFTPEGNLVVSDNGNYRIQTLTPKGEFISKFGNTPGLFRPKDDSTLFRVDFYVPRTDEELSDNFTVMVNHRGKIVVVDRTFGRISLREPNGAMIKSLPSPGPKYFQPISGCVGPNGEIIICDLRSHTVQIFSPGGDLIRVFGKHGNRKGQFYCPWGVSVDGEGRMVVCDSMNQRFQIFSAQGKFLKKIPIKCGSPRLSVLDHSGRILSIDIGTRSVRVFGAPDQHVINKSTDR